MLIQGYSPTGQCERDGTMGGSCVLTDAVASTISEHDRLRADLARSQAGGRNSTENRRVYTKLAFIKQTSCSTADVSLN